MSQRQRQPSSSNPSGLSTSPSISSSVSSSSSQSQIQSQSQGNSNSYPTSTVGPGGAQYINVPPSGSTSSSGGGLTSPPTTPFHSEESRLLPTSTSHSSSSSSSYSNNNSTPGSPMDFGVTPIPPPPRSSSKYAASVSGSPSASASASSPPPNGPGNVLAPSPLTRSHISPSPSQTQPQSQTFSSIPNPFSAASRGGSSVGINGNNNNSLSPNSNPASPPSSRPISRGSTAPFPAYNVSNPPPSQGHPNAYVYASGPSSSSSSQSHANNNQSTLHTTPTSSSSSSSPEDGVLATLGLGANSSGFPSSMGARGAGSMVLYRLADDPRGSTMGSVNGTASASASSRDLLLLPPRFGGGGGGGGTGTGTSTPRSSLGSSLGGGEGGADTSSSSVLSFSDSKYPFAMNHSSSAGGGGGGTNANGTNGSVRGLIPYAYDPSLDENEPLDEEDLLHDPNPKAWMSGKYDRLASSPRLREHPLTKGGKPTSTTTKRPKTKFEKNHFPWRGVLNVSALLFLLLGLLTLFAIYPILTFYRDRARNERIEGNVRINGTGQAAALFQMPDPIDADTPESAKTRTGFDGYPYELVFSDEFNVEGRTFWPGDDPFWEGVNLWYGATQDLEWYDPSQLTTRDGALIITMDSTSTTQSHLTPGSTAPFTEADNHQMTYRSGMLQSWNKFCFTTGYIEVAVTFPGPDQSTQGYWPGAWTMGNLARPGYAATTEGLWPYTYDSCDVGTFPNQTYKDGSGPASALTSTRSRPAYNYDLSWLPGQRLSACSCPGADHPGPTYNRGRGAPEIDIFEAEKDKDIPIVGIVSQSGQFAPFAHDYTYSNDSGGWTNFDPTRTRANTYRGSAVQQSVSGLTRVPADMFQGQPGGGNFKTFGFEYWSDINDREGGSITWQVDGQKSHRVIASAVGPDMGDGGTLVGQRLIPEEPMSIVLNLGISANWQKIDLTTMQFPAEMKVDYVRVYQRKGHTNTGCDPKNYPTADYIARHLQAYTDVNMTSWPYEKPKNSKYDGC